MMWVRTIRASRLALLFALMAGSAACHHKPRGISAGDVCYKLEAAGVAATCQVGSRGEDAGLLTRGASERVVFGLPSAPGKTGQVLLYKRAAEYQEAVADFETASFLVGPHRYGSEKALIFVQLNKDVPSDVGARAALVVAGLSLGKQTVQP